MDHPHLLTKKKASLLLLTFIYLIVNAHAAQLAHFWYKVIKDVQRKEEGVRLSCKMMMMLYPG